MRAKKHTSLYVPLGLVVFFGLMALLLWPTLVTAVPLTAKQQLDRTWRFAGDVGSYQYRTGVVQTTHPTARLENAGRQVESSRMTVEGAVDRANDTLDMRLWASGAGRDGLELKVEGGKTYGRAGSDDEWNDIDNPTEMFAPGGDPLGFLAAAENIQIPSTGAGPDSQTDDSDLPSYTFEINGLSYAKSVRSQLEDELRRSGELPFGVTLGLARQYVDMKAHGEIWLNEFGLPSRQTIYMEFPPDKGAFEWVEADITTTFSDWAADGVDHQLKWAIPRVVDDPSILADDPLSLLPNLSSLPTVPDEALKLGLTLGFILSLMALIVMAVVHRLIRLTEVYGALAIVITLSLLVTPLLQTHVASAFTQDQHDQQAEYEKERSNQQKLQELQDEMSGRDFDPKVNPLAGAPNGPVAKSPSLSLQTASQSVLGSTKPGAPLKPNTQTAEPNFVTGADFDGDGLNDEVELLKLGTEADQVDSDADGISDKTEVVGFSYSGQLWHLDPLSIDTNGDTLMDVAECPALEDINPDDKSLGTPSGSVCRDIDGDGTPDVFDFDNDGDGVPDVVDSSPDYTGDLTTIPQDVMEFELDSYATGKPLYVDFEFRPTAGNADHLWYTNNVMDWPDNDKAGQLTRISDTTLSSVDGFSGGKTANGDIMLTPMLEIEIPAPSDNPSNPSGGLPVLPGVNESTLGDADIEDWLDTDALDGYNITASQSEDGRIYAYSPLYLIEDPTGDTPVAWAGRAFYNTANSTWGAAHKARMIWLITAVVDECDPDCENPDSVTTTAGIIQTYYEKFHLTGFSVGEQHGMDSLVIAQTDAVSATHENYLWHLYSGLEQAFIGPELVDGNRFDLFQIENRFDNNSVAGDLDPRRWGIPKSKLDVTSFSAPDPNIGWNDLMNNGIEGILTANYGEPTADTRVTLLFAREDAIKLTTLDDSDAVSVAGSTLSVDLGALGQQTFASMNWSPYIYDGLSWVSDDLTEYLGYLDTQMNLAINGDIVKSGV